MQDYNLRSWKREIDYDMALMLQEEAMQKIKRFDADDFLILLRHEPVVTLGHSAKEKDILEPKEFLKKKGIKVCKTDRGGEVTYHGPGQLIGYLVIDIHRKTLNLRDYKSKLCKTLIDLLKDYDIEAEEGHGKLSGLWVEDKKIAAIGYAIKKFYDENKLNVITKHGFALYVLDEMENFKYINPCGMPGMKLTNMEQILKKKIDFEELKEKYVKHFEKVFEYEVKT